MNRFIIMGPRSVGKSTVGKELAKKINVNYFDFDEVVDKKLKGIIQYSKKYGFDFYRIEERKILINFLSKLPKEFVISVGGGTVASQLKEISKKNSRDLKKAGKIIYLIPSKSKKQSIEILHKREQKRKGDKDYNETKKLFELRNPIYDKIYDVKIIVNNKTTTKIVKEILKSLSQHKNLQ